MSNEGWEEFKIKAVSAIRLTIVLKLKYSVWLVNESSPVELWKKLEKIYMSK